MTKTFSLAVASLTILSVAVPARATYSIVATDPMTGQCGVAVQIDNLAVGASVPYAQAGVGAIASQFETNPKHGPLGLALLAKGMSPAEVMQQLLREDGNFERRGPEARQLAIVSADGRTSVHTGEDAAQADWAGARSGPGYSVQGNGLVGPQVLAAMEQTFLASSGLLAERLLAALSAGDRAGGQQTGRESAALLVRTREGFPLEIDLRVDHADDPVGQLRFLYGLQSARQEMIQARLAARRGNFDEAKILLATGAARATTWPRACILAAQVAVEIEQPVLASQYLALAFDRSPVWISKIIGGGDFASLGHDPAFHRWIGPELERNTLGDYRKIIATKEAPDDGSLALARRLLEIGCARESLAVLERISRPTSDIFLLRATALEANGSPSNAVEQCQAGLKANPLDTRLKLRLVRLQQSIPGRL